jgi:hypothetical protein
LVCVHDPLCFPFKTLKTLVGIFLSDVI